MAKRYDISNNVKHIPMANIFNNLDSSHNIRCIQLLLMIPNGIKHIRHILLNILDL